jgi:hypothetical protein
MLPRSNDNRRRLASSAFIALALSMVPPFAVAQTPAKTSVPEQVATASPSPAPSPAATPDDKPSFRAGATIFSDFTYTETPKTKDADGNTVRNSAFDVSRAYLTVTGAISHLVSFRVSADVRRLSGANASTATSVDGSEVFRLKYAYGQISLDSVLSKGSWVRIGAQQTPFVDYAEAIYRYRFQGTQMVERDGFLSSSDFGITGRVVLPNEYGDVHLGVYNGESYAKGEANDQKSFQIRGSLRPLPRHTVLKGLRLTAFYNADRYFKGAPRNRFVASAAFEHNRLVLGADLVEARDRTSVRAALVESSGFSVWARPRTTIGLEGLLRYDSFKPNNTVDARRTRTILGAAYWFKTQSPVSAALLADYERVSYAASLAKPREGRLALHCLFQF